MSKSNNKNRQRSNKDRSKGRKPDDKGQPGNRDKERDKGKGKSQQERINPAWDPQVYREGDTLRRFANSMMRLQTRPQIRGYQREADQLRDILKSLTNQELSLGKQASETTASYYKSLAGAEQQNLARQQALGQRLKSDVSGGNVAAQQQIGAAGQEALGRLDTDAELRKSVPSRARDELQQMIAQQQMSSAQQGQAGSQYAAGRAADWESVMGTMAQANQMRGGTAQTDIQREIINRITGLQQEYGPGIQQALGKAADVRASRGDVRRDIINELFGSERDWLATQKALKLDEASLAEERRSAKASEKSSRKEAKAAAESGTNQKAIIQEYKELAKLKANLSRRNQKLSAKDNRRLAELKALISKRNIKLSQGGGDSGGGGQNLNTRIKDEYDASDRRSAIADVREILDEEGSSHVRDNRRKIKQFLHQRTGRSPLLYEWAIQKLLKGGGGGGGSSGPTQFGGARTG